MEPEVRLIYEIIKDMGHEEIAGYLVNVLLPAHRVEVLSDVAKDREDQLRRKRKGNEVASEFLEENKLLIEALEFYANPENYVAIMFLKDPPCGGFADDFEEITEEIYDHPLMIGTWRPGKKARDALQKIGRPIG